MIHVVPGWIVKVRVRVLNRRREKDERRREVEREERKKNEGNRVITFYIRRWTGWVLTRSSAPRPRPLDLDPIGSGSIQRPWCVLRIRIHQPAWVWAGQPWAFGFLSSFWSLLLYSPTVSLFGPPVHSTFFTKISENYCVFLVCLWLFLWYFYMLKIDENDRC